MFSARSSKTYAIPPLISGGVMLSYRCSNRCRHCLYRCSPQRPDDWMSIETAERVFSALAQEPHLDSIHLAGGEATLRFDLLLNIVRLAKSMAVPVAYLETNAGWCSDRATTREKLQRLKEAGLPAILVSCSMFHNEFVPFERTRICVEESAGVFGQRNVIIWLPHLYQILSQMPGERDTHTLEEFCSWAGLPQDSGQIPLMYHVIPGGRAPEALRNCYILKPARAFRQASCQRDLLSTTHFHVDLYGNLFTGLCAGIAPGDSDNLHPDITPDAFPVTYTLCDRGPWGLMELAEQSGFQPREDGYASKCDLCCHVRTHLHETGGFRELRPADYYAPSPT